MLELKYNPFFNTRETSNKLFKVMNLETDSQDQVLGLLTPFMKGTCECAVV